MEIIDHSSEYLRQLSPLVIGVIAVVLVFLVIGLRLVLKKPPSHLTAFSGSSGSVLVSRKALQELIKQACLLDEWVEAARPVVRLRNTKVSAVVELRLAAPENLKDVCERVQERITALLQKSLSFEQIGDIQIVVKSFSPAAEAEAHKALEQESIELTLEPPKKKTSESPIVATDSNTEESK